MTTLREAAQQALEALEMMRQKYGEYACSACDHADAAITALRAALAQQEEPVTGIIESKIKVDSHQTLDDAMQQPRAMAQAYEAGYKAGQVHERELVIQFLQEMQRVVGEAHNHYGVAAVRIKERI